MVILELKEEELLRMKGILLDRDAEDALELIKVFVKRLEDKSARGLKSHLDG